MVVQAPEDPVEPVRAGRFPLLVATAGGAGHAPVAPGTFGSAVGVVAYWLLAGLGPVLFVGATVGLFLLGTWSADTVERHYGRKDDGRIVIDEVVGQLVTLAPLLFLGSADERRAPALLAVGFFAFRLFDIWKPGPVRMAERRFPGGLGVMLDDVVAGALAALAVTALVAWR